jgi:hypothetical protein
MRNRHVLALSGLLLCTELLAGCSDPHAIAVSDDFSMYLAAPTYTVPQMMAGELVLDHLAIDASPILGLDDIISYTWDDHTLEVTDEARDRLISADLGRVFVVTALGERIYMGAFWEPTSSIAYAEICISKWELQRENMPVHLWSSVAAGAEDKRADPRVRRALEAAGKLR